MRTFVSYSMLQFTWKFHSRSSSLLPKGREVEGEENSEMLDLFSRFPCIKRVWVCALGIVLQTPETPCMTWMRNVSHSPVLKRASMMKQCGTPVFFTLVGKQEKTFITLSSAQIRCLYLFRAEEINTEWSIVGHGERERHTKQRRGGGRGGYFLKLLAFISVWPDGISPGAGKKLEADPLLEPPSRHQQPPFRLPHNPFLR